MEFSSVQFRNTCEQKYKYINLISFIKSVLWKIGGMHINMNKDADQSNALCTTSNLAQSFQSWSHALKYRLHLYFILCFYFPSIFWMVRQPITQSKTLIPEEWVTDGSTLREQSYKKLSKYNPFSKRKSGAGGFDCKSISSCVSELLLLKIEAAELDIINLCQCP